MQDQDPSNPPSAFAVEGVFGFAVKGVYVSLQSRGFCGRSLWVWALDVPSLSQNRPHVGVERDAVEEQEEEGDDDRHDARRCVEPVLMEDHKLAESAC